MSMSIFSASELKESLMKLMFASSTLMKTMAAIWSRRMVKRERRLSLWKKWTTFENIPNLSTTNTVDNNHAKTNFCAKEQKKVQANSERVCKRRGGTATTNITEAADATANNSSKGGAATNNITEAAAATANN